MSDNSHYQTVKISEEAKLAAQVIRDHHMPDREMQEVYSMAILDYLHAYHAELEPLVANMYAARQKARREQAEG